MIDLDEAKQKREAARRESEGKGPVIKFGGVDYELPAELPYGVLEALAQVADEEQAAGALTSMTRSLLGEYYENFTDTNPSMDDVNELIGGAMREYGLSSPLG